MDQNPAQCVPYRRSRFSTRLPTDRLYTPGHFWMLQESAGVWRVGLTKLATRMLGELVEHGFDVKVGQPVKLGECVGWLEGFKAVSDLYSSASGEFLGGNPDLEQNINLVDTDPYGQGWLFRVRGSADPEALDVDRYIQILDLSIDTMMGKGSANGGGEGLS